MRYRCNPSYVVNEKRPLSQLIQFRASPPRSRHRERGLRDGYISGSPTPNMESFVEISSDFDLTRGWNARRIAIYRASGSSLEDDRWYGRFRLKPTKSPFYLGQPKRQ